MHIETFEYDIRKRGKDTKRIYTCASCGKALMDYRFTVYQPEKPKESFCPDCVMTGYLIHWKQIMTVRKSFWQRICDWFSGACESKGTISADSPADDAV